MDLLDPNRYTVAWIAPLGIEARAALLLLDRRHPGRFPLGPGDDYTYEAGEMCGHNVIIATLPSGQEYGTGAAAAIASQVKTFFPRLWLGLLVGVAAGLPNLQRDPPLDIRLGDVLVGLAEGDNAGLIAYELGKETGKDGFQLLRAGHVLCQTKTVIRSAIGSIKLHAPDDAEVFLPYYEHFKDKRHIQGSFADPGQENDALYQVDDQGCERLVPREPRPSSGRTRVWYGPIGSGDKLVKNARKRNELRDRHNIIGLEMEAAGTMNRIPVGVIRGVCDYGDEHKNEKWQPYAAAMAASYAKAVLAQIPPKVVARVGGQVVENASGMASRSKHRLDDNYDDPSSVTHRKAKSARMTDSDTQSSPSQTLPDQASSSNAGQGSLDRQRIKALLDSLEFDQMNSRHDGIEKAYGGTCEWLSTTPEYIDWLEPEKLDQHHGFLWIKGNPGAGKSTLMKSALRKAQKTKNITFLSFFFHDRGNELEKTTIGMYRSLLLQLLEKIPRLQSVFNPLRRTMRNGSIPQWSTKLLKSLFEQAVQNLGRSPLTCFIDALDECDESEIRDMMAFFEAVGETSVPEGIIFRVCLSSRHYPHITIAKGLTLDLGRQEGHDQDIVSYVKGKLRIGISRVANRIRSRLIEKASGIFIWVVLVVEILNKEFDHGNMDALSQRLQQIPDDLNDLFRDILTRDGRCADKLLLCIQWLLFARQPLAPVQLYLAILVGDNATAAANWRHGEIDEADMRRYILSSSKGLAEINKSKKTPKVQFIHESVREFFLKEGLTRIWPELKGDFKGESHEQLKQCCLEYMSIGKAGLVFEPMAAKSDKQSQVRESTNLRFPLLEYVFRNVVYHAEEAAAGGVDQAGFLQNFDRAGWVKLEAIFEQHATRQHRSTTSLLYILAELNAANLISAYEDRLSGFETEEGDERYGIPILAAVATNSRRAVYAILKACADAEPSTPSLQGLCEQYRRSELDRNSHTCTFRFSKKKVLTLNIANAGDDLVLMFALASSKVNTSEAWNASGLKTLLDAARAGREVVLRQFFDQYTYTEAAGCILGESLRLAAEGGHEGIVQFFLDKSASIEEGNGIDGYTAMHLAAKNGHEGAVRLLLDNGAAIGAVSIGRSTPLHLAAAAGRVGVVRLLLNRGSNIEATTNEGMTPLLLAARAGERERVTIQLLLDRGANKTKADPSGRTALSLAAGSGAADAVRLLLDHGADVNDADDSGRTPLSWAAQSGRADVIKLLLGAGAKVEAADTSGRTPLSFAAASGRKSFVQLLLDHGADIEKADDSGRTPLPWSFNLLSGPRDVACLLLNRGAKVDAADTSGRTPLSWAAESGQPDLIELLLGAGAKVDAADAEGRTPLAFAISQLNSLTAELLLCAGANIRAADRFGNTPLSLSQASYYGDDSIKQLLARHAAMDDDATEMRSRPSP